MQDLAVNAADASVTITRGGVTSTVVPSATAASYPGSLPEIVSGAVAEFNMNCIVANAEN